MKYFQILAEKEHFVKWSIQEAKIFVKEFTREIEGHPSNLSEF